jgi:ABC-type glycerol-3-phosphate transport system substrate-binding protein
MSEEAQKILVDVGGYIPINTNIFDDSLYLGKNPELIFEMQLIKNGIYRPFSVRYTNVSDVVSYYLNLCIKGNLTPDEALYKADEELNSKSILLK